LFRWCFNRFELFLEALLFGVVLSLAEILGFRTDQVAVVPAPAGPRPGRLIGVSTGAVEALCSAPQAAVNAASEGQEASPIDAGTTVPEAPEVPLGSAENLGRQHERSPFRVIRAEGPIYETLACFQMLSGLMTVPFRKDAIEKVLREQLRRGQPPNRMGTMPHCHRLA
jgi:ATP-binding cassette subfamily B protein